MHAKTSNAKQAETQQASEKTIGMNKQSAHKRQKSIQNGGAKSQLSVLNRLVYIYGYRKST